MNILYDYQMLVNQKYGGISRYHYELATHLKQYAEVSVDIPVLWSKNYYFESFFNKKSLDNYNFVTARLVNKINQMNTLYIAKKQFEKYDIIHPTYYNPYIINKFKGKLVVTVHDMIHEIYKTKFPQNDPTSHNKRKIVMSADKVIAISQNTKKDILKFYPEIDENKIAVIYHGNSAINNVIGEKCFLKLPEPYVLFVGSRWGYKNFDIFFKAMCDILKMNKDINLVCAGGGGFNNNELEEIKKMKLQGRIHQYSFNDEELGMAYRQAMCFVFPSKYEGFGIPILEAFSNDCPVVLSNASSFPEVGGEAALYTNPDNYKEMAEKVWDLINDTNQRMRLIELGRRRVLDFSMDKMVQNTFDLYKELL